MWFSELTSDDNKMFTFVGFMQLPREKKLRSVCGFSILTVFSV